MNTLKRATGFYWLIKAPDPRLRAIQQFIVSWQRSGADPRTQSLVIDDISKVLDGTYRT